MAAGLLEGVLVCAGSATLSNLGLILMKSAVTASNRRVVVESLISPTSLDEDDDDDEDDDGSDDRADRGGVCEAAGRRRDAFRERRMSSSFLEDVIQTQRTSRKVLSRANAWWALGLAVFVVGQVLNLVSLSLLEQVVWAVVSLFSLISNAFFSWAILNEPFHVRDLAATLLIMVGSVLVVVANDVALAASGSVQAGPWTLAEFLAHFHNPWFLAYCGLLTSLLLTSIVLGVRAVGRGHTINALTWTVLSATCGAVSVLLGKCLVGLVAIVQHAQGGFGGPEATSVLSAPSSYVILIVFVFAAVGALVSLNLALAAGEALLVIPWLTVMNTLLAILGGISYFEEFSSLQSVWRAVLFVVGVATAIVGSIMVQQGRVKTARRLSVDLGSNIILPLPEEPDEDGASVATTEASHVGEASKLLSSNGSWPSPPRYYTSGVPELTNNDVSAANGMAPDSAFAAHSPAAHTNGSAAPHFPPSSSNSSFEI